MIHTVYSDMCSVVSVTMKSEYELVSDAVLETDLHLSEYHVRSYIRWLVININVLAIIIPPSTVVVSCTIKATMFIIVVVWSTNFIPLWGLAENKSSPSPVNLQQSVGILHWHFHTISPDWGLQILDSSLVKFSLLPFLFLYHNPSVVLIEVCRLAPRKKFTLQDQLKKSGLNSLSQLL